MNNLQVIEHKKQRVLTTEQIADSYGTDRKVISKNFTNNKQRYIEGKHYFFLEGIDLKAIRKFYDLPRNINKLYLWTEKGAFLHAKSLNTDEAWDVYDKLVETYFKAKEILPQLNTLSPQLQLLIQIEMEQNKIKEEVNEVKETVNTITEVFLHKDEDWRKYINKMINKAVVSSSFNYREMRNYSYELLEKRGKCSLDIRLKNLKNRLVSNGATKTKINQTNKLDVIELDARLKEIYTTIAKELSIGSLNKNA